MNFDTVGVIHANMDRVEGRLFRDLGLTPQAIVVIDVVLCDEGG